MIQYTTKHCENNFKEPKITFNAKFPTSKPGLWNRYVDMNITTLTVAPLLISIHSMQG